MMYPRLNKKAFTIPVATALCLSSIVVAQAATLGERAVYQMKILAAGDPAQIGQCSAFTFGDVSQGGCKGPFADNEDLSPGFPDFQIEGGNGVAGDGVAGVITIETSRADPTGNNTFTVVTYQVDPYLGTAGGTFKTTMTPPSTPPPPLPYSSPPNKVQVAAINNGSGTLTAAGGMTLDVDGRTGIAAAYVSTLGLQEWNRDDTTKVNITTETGLYETFSTGANSNANPTTGAINLTLTGRAIADTAPTDGILDAILISAGNVGVDWTGFDGTPYTEAFNVQFVLVSAKPVAQADTIPAFVSPTTTMIQVADLLSNDTHAEGDTLVLNAISGTTTESANGSSIVNNNNGTLTYTPPTSGGATQDSFTYTVIDLDSNTDTATVTVLFPTDPKGTAANDSPAALDEDTSITFDPIANDTPPPSGTIALFDFQGVSVKAGTIVSAGGNSLTYTPVANFFGSDSFTYRALDSNNNLLTATVNLVVNPVNDPLVCTDVSLSTPPIDGVLLNTPLTININTALLSTCTDIDTTDTITLDSWQAATPQGGTVTAGTAGRLVYTPALNFSGTDTFTYTATDGTAYDIPRTVTVTVGIFGNFTMLLKSAGDTFGGTNDIKFDWPAEAAVRGGDLSSLNTDEVDYTNNLKFNMSIISSRPEPFFGSIWTAHSIRVFGPGTYSFDSGCTVSEITTTGCPAGSAAVSGPAISMTVGAGQIGAHILFDYNGSYNIDVLNVWDIDGVWDDPDGATTIKNNLWSGPSGSNPDPTAIWKLVSRDVNGDGINGMPMVDGPFLGYYANFSDTPDKIIPPPADITSTVRDTRLGGGVLGLASLLGIAAVIGFFRRRLGS